MCKISIITPSYNQAEFLEQTIQSVISQNYSNLEYIIIDGDSTDGSVDIIKKYSRYIDYWVSEQDNGQSHAINKGFKLATGDIYAWLNSDDYYNPDTLNYVSGKLKNLIDSPNWVIGGTERVDTNGRVLYKRLPPSNIDLINTLSWPKNWFPQQSTFWTREMWLKAGPLNEKLHYVMDYSLWLSMLCYSKPIITQQILSHYRLHQEAKCSVDRFTPYKETLQIVNSHFQSDQYLRKSFFTRLKIRGNNFFSYFLIAVINKKYSAAINIAFITLKQMYNSLIKKK